MQFFRKWLRVERSAVALHPGRIVEVNAPQPDVFDRCINAIENVLGGHTDAADRARGSIEASFGLVNSERLSISLESIDAVTTRARIESRRGAISTQPVSSSYVDALAAYLTN